MAVCQPTDTAARIPFVEFEGATTAEKQELIAVIASLQAKQEAVATTTHNEASAVHVNLTDDLK